MSGEKTESIISKVIVGVLVAVCSTFLIVRLGINNGGTKSEAAKPEKTVEFRPAVAGVYTGTVRNLTVGGTGKLVLNLDQQASGKVTGSLNISGQLTGSGNLEGYVDGQRISFISKEQSSDISISWEGMVEGNQVSGTYTASMPSYLKAQGMPDQEGQWEVGK